MDVKKNNKISVIQNTEARRRQRVTCGSSGEPCPPVCIRSLGDPAQFGPLEVSRFPFFHQMKLETQRNILQNVLPRAEGQCGIEARYSDRALSEGGAFHRPESLRRSTQG